MSKTRVPNEYLLSDVGRANQLVNGGFENWQRGLGPFTASSAYHADKWQLQLAGTDTLSISRDTANVDIGSQADAVCIFTLGTGAGQTIFWQYFRPADGGQLAGRTISYSVRVRTSVANAVRASIWGDGTGAVQQYSSYHSGNGLYQTLTVTYTIPVNMTYFSVGLMFAASCTAYVDNAMVVVGSVGADYVPLPPADDLARCMRYYETIGQGSGEYIGTGQVASANIVYLPVKYAMRKALAAPTVTIVTPTQIYATQANTAQILASASAAYSPVQGSTMISLTGLTGLVAGNASLVNSNGGYITVEANP